MSHTHSHTLTHTHTLSHTLTHTHTHSHTRVFVNGRMRTSGCERIRKTTVTSTGWTISALVLPVSQPRFPSCPSLSLEVGEVGRVEVTGSIYITSCKRWSSTGRVCRPLHMDTSYSLVSCTITQENYMHVSMMEALPMSDHEKKFLSLLQHH